MAFLLRFSVCFAQHENLKPGISASSVLSGIADTITVNRSDTTFIFSKKNPEQTINRKGRSWFIGSISVSAYGGSFVALSDAWFTGYGADGMFGESENTWKEPDSGLPINHSDIPRQRQFYLAPDVDFTKIRTNKKWLPTFFFCLNVFKCPAPALMVNSKGTLRIYPVYF